MELESLEELEVPLVVNMWVRYLICAIAFFTLPGQR